MKYFLLYIFISTSSMIFSESYIEIYIKYSMDLSKELLTDNDLTECQRSYIEGEIAAYGSILIAIENYEWDALEN